MVPGMNGFKVCAQAVLGTLLAFVALLTVLSLAGVVVKALSDTDGSNRLDAHVLDWMIDRRSDGLTEIMRAVTTLGSTLVLMPLTVVGVVVLSAMRRFWLAGYLATVVIGASLLSATTKAIVDRTRPPVDVRLASVGESSFPSGHATQAAATYLAVAIIVAIVIRSAVLRRVLWGLCALIVVGVGLSRLYLGVHWFTDVIAGWSAGAAWALAVAYVFRPLDPADSDGMPRSFAAFTHPCTWSRSRAA